MLTGPFMARLAWAEIMAFARPCVEISGASWPIGVLCPPGIGVVVVVVLTDDVEVVAVETASVEGVDIFVSFCLFIGLEKQIVVRYADCPV